MRLKKIVILFTLLFFALPSGVQAKIVTGTAAGVTATVTADNGGDSPATGEGAQVAGGMIGAMNFNVGRTTLLPAVFGTDSNKLPRVMVPVLSYPAPGSSGGQLDSPLTIYLDQFELLRWARTFAANDTGVPADSPTTVVLNSDQVSRLAIVLANETTFLKLINLFMDSDFARSWVLGAADTVGVRGRISIDSNGLGLGSAVSRPLYVQAGISDSPNQGVTIQSIKLRGGDSSIQVDITNVVETGVFVVNPVDTNVVVKHPVSDTIIYIASIGSARSVTIPTSLSSCYVTTDSDVWFRIGAAAAKGDGAGSYPLHATAGFVYLQFTIPAGVTISTVADNATANFYMYCGRNP